MNKNKFPIIIGSITIFVALFIVFAQQNTTKTNEIIPQTDTVVNPNTSDTATKPTTATTPPKSTSDGYTLAIVASHNTSSSCWTVVNGSVYDVTKWI